MSHKLAAKFAVTLHTLRERGQSGQNSLEYIGIAVVAAVVIVAITAALDQINLKDTLTKAVNDIFGKK